jgi:transposase
VQKQACVSCKHSWWPKIPFTEGKQRMSNSFVSYALDLLKFGTIKDVANHLNIGWDVVKGIHKKYLGNLYEDIDISNIKYISIDEFAIAKRHKYMTIILDIQSGRIIYAIEGRKKKDIEPTLKELKKKPQA